MYCAEHGDIFKIKGVKSPTKQGEDFHICSVEVARPAAAGQDLPVLVHKRSPEGGTYQVHTVCGNPLFPTAEKAAAWETQRAAVDKQEEDDRKKRLAKDAKDEALEAAKAAAAAQVEADWLAKQSKK